MRNENDAVKSTTCNTSTNTGTTGSSTTNTITTDTASDFLTDADIQELLNEPRNYGWYSSDTWSEVLPGLFQGGTHDHDTVRRGRPQGSAEVGIAHFDFVATLYVSALPVAGWVHEMRFGINDYDMTDFNVDDVRVMVTEAHRRWKDGQRVLIRCQAGLNRSGLITTLVLMREGFTADEAIHLIRRVRGGMGMSNPTFEEWLRSDEALEWVAAA
jgi:hypothetical protein